MEFFQEIDKVKCDLPKLKNVSNEVSNIETNIYQKITIIIFLICIFLGIFFGNLFPACGSSSELYSGFCATTEFNFSLMLFIWFFSFIGCMFFYMIGHIISLLTSINNKMAKK